MQGKNHVILFFCEKMFFSLPLGGRHGEAIQFRRGKRGEKAYLRG